MIGMHLLLFAAVVSTLAPQVLTRAGWAYRSPRLGIVAWYGTLVAVLSAVGVAVVSLVAPWQGADAPVCMLWRWCVQAAAGGYGTAGRVVVTAATVVGAAIAAQLLVTAVRVVGAASTRRDRHMQILTLAGRISPELDATVVDHPHPAAYVVGGSTRRVVVTTGAIDVLAGPELAAVLAHEKAHTAGRHDLLVDGIRLLEKAFPRVGLFTAARGELCRLVELRADEVATVHHAPISLARAMVTMATAASRARPAPASPMLAGALSATGGDAIERLHRLLTPPMPLRGAHRAMIGAGAAALALAPAAFVVAAQVLPWLGACPPLMS